MERRGAPTCVICTDELFALAADGQSYTASAITACQCGHVYHDECIMRWICSNSQTCPQCRVYNNELLLKRLYFTDGCGFFPLAQHDQLNSNNHKRNERDQHDDDDGEDHDSDDDVYTIYSCSATNPQRHDEPPFLQEEAKIPHGEFNRLPIANSFENELFARFGLSVNELNDQLSDSEKKQSILEELQSEHDTLQQKLSAMCKQLSDCQAKSERRRVELYRLQKCNHSKSINTRFGSEKTRLLAISQLPTLMQQVLTLNNQRCSNDELRGELREKSYKQLVDYCMLMSFKIGEMKSQMERNRLSVIALKDACHSLKSALATIDELRTAEIELRARLRSFDQHNRNDSQDAKSDQSHESWDDEMEAERKNQNSN